jgi:2-methylcitrate dehydratase PrpD
MKRKPIPAITRRFFMQAAAAYAAGGVSGLSAEATPQTAAATDRTGSMMSALARFIAGSRFETIPPAAVATAKTAIMDCLGVAVAGGREESAQIIGKMVRGERSKEEVTIYGQRFKSSVSQAALVNGVAAHAHDFDHSFVLGGQPTSPIIPAVFALGEVLGVSGKQALEAYVTGFEVTAAMLFALQNAGGAGWHANGTLGAFGAAAACAKLLEMKEPEIEMTLAITASLASGVSSNFGTMTKPLHVGHAARNGLLAAQLGKSGFTANVQTLQARNGFVDTYYPGGKLDMKPLDDLGRVYSMEKFGVRFKPYPCGGLTHTAIYSAIRLRNEHRITPETVEHVDVAVSADAAAPLRFRTPANALEGKFSMPYLIARALVDGNITLDTFTEQAVRDKAVLQLLDRVEMKVDPGMQSGSDGSRPATVTIRLKSGQTETLHQKFPKGSPQVPMSEDELVAKFRGCCRGVIGDTSSTRALEQIRKLESMSSIRPLAALLL